MILVFVKKVDTNLACRYVACRSTRQPVDRSFATFKRYGRQYGKINGISDQKVIKKFICELISGGNKRKNKRTVFNCGFF